MPIRKMRQGDKEEIIKICEKLSKWFNKQGIRNLKRRFGNEERFVYTKNNNIIGFVIYKKWKYKAEITCLGVLEQYQNKGIGSELVKHLERELRKDKVGKLKVSTLAPTINYRPYEKTRKFYKKMGFEKVKVNKNFWQNKYDRLVMEKVI